MLGKGASPNPHHLQGSNICQIALALNERTGTAVILSAIDNLVKGAAGQAVQNMNLMVGFDETAGLPSVGLFP